jgi:sulfonate transport system substrate-binding protein
MTDQDSKSTRTNRRVFLSTGLGVAATTGLGAFAFHARNPRPIAAKVAVLKVGDQRGGAKAMMQASGVLAGVPYKIEWAEMPAAAPLLEALSAGAIDLGGIGAAPFAFAYSNGAEIKAVLASRILDTAKGVGRSSAILVSKTSHLKTTKDLQGHRLATIKGSAGHDLALRILERDGVDPKSVQFVYLNNGDAKAALASGSIDAWSTWGTYVGIAVLEDGDRVLADATGLITAGAIGNLLAASDKALATKEPLIRDFLKRYIEARDWAHAHREDYAAAIARETGIPLKVALYSTAATAATSFVPIDASLLAEQRTIFERYLRAGVIDRLPPLDATGYATTFNNLLQP